MIRLLPACLENTNTKENRMAKKTKKIFFFILLMIFH